MQEREIFFCIVSSLERHRNMPNYTAQRQKKSANFLADFNYWIRDEEKDEMAVRFFFDPVLLTFATITTITTITTAASATLAATA